MRRFSDDDRTIVLSAVSMGPKMVGYLEAAGVNTLAELAGREAGELALAINVALGKRRINSLGVAALANAVTLARQTIHIPKAFDSTLPASWRNRIDALLAGAGRVVIGLAGTPGAGKSSAAASIAAAWGDTAVVVPMDGFHLAQKELERLGRANRKGAPDTFDAAGFAELLRRIRQTPGETIYAPAFRREIEEPVAGAIAVQPHHRLIVTEGNYLLLETPPWDRIRPLLDACWYIDIAAGQRIERLVARHVAFGRSLKAAREWVLRSDEANAAVIEQARRRADWTTNWPEE